MGDIPDKSTDHSDIPKTSDDWNNLISSQPYNPADAVIQLHQAIAQKTLKLLRDCKNDHERSRRAAEIFQLEEGGRCVVRDGFRAEFGWNIRVEGLLFLNFNVVILDIAPVHFKGNVLVGPGVHIYTVTHPLDGPTGPPRPTIAYPVTVGRDCVIGGQSIILPGVTLGDGVVVGAGSVVTKSIPSRCVVAGNPARIIRNLGQTSLINDPVSTA